MERLVPMAGYPGGRANPFERSPVVPTAAAVPAASEAMPSAPTAAMSVPMPETGLARAFVIAQASIYPMYEPMEGWDRGTVFVSLDKPLKGVSGCGSD